MKLRDISDTLYYTKKKAAKRDYSLTPRDSKLERDWNRGVKRPPGSRYLLLLLLITFIFLLVAVGIAYYIRLSGIDRTVSSNKIEVVTRGHHAAESGIPLPLTVRVTNNNPVPIRQVMLSVSYPPGTYRSEGSESAALLQQEEFLWDVVLSGQTVEKGINPVFYGREHEKKRIQYTLKYIPENSQQSMEIARHYDVSVRTIPLSVTRIARTNPVVGKPATFTFTVRRNTAERVPAAYVELRYPTGFVPTRFSRNPFNPERTRFLVPDLGSDSEWKFNVTGAIRGDEHISQAMVANIFVIPTGSRGTPVLVDKKESLFEVSKAFLDIGLSMGREDDGEYHIVSPGEIINAVITWSNADVAQLEDVVITASLSGSGLNESSIAARDNGHFDEVRREVIWDKKQVPSFEDVGSGRSGRLGLQFRALPDRVEFAQPDKFIEVRISAEAKRVATGGIERIRDIAVGRVYLRSVLQVAENVAFAEGEVKNEGPIPPKVGEKTTYSLMYFIKNSGNELSDFTMHIPLSRTVELTGVAAGLRQGELAYDEERNIAVITLSSVAGTGVESGRTIELQVAAVPQNQDVNDFIELTQEGSFSAYDTHTRETFRGTVEALSTKHLSKDTFSREHKGRVAE